jgi:hypothetical protein
MIRLRACWAVQSPEQVGYEEVTRQDRLGLKTPVTTRPSGRTVTAVTPPPWRPGLTGPVPGSAGSRASTAISDPQARASRPGPVVAGRRLG